MDNIATQPKCVQKIPDTLLSAQVDLQYAKKVPLPATPWVGHEIPHIHY